MHVSRGYCCARWIQNPVTDLVPHGRRTLLRIYAPGICVEPYVCPRFCGLMQGAAFLAVRALHPATRFLKSCPAEDVTGTRHVRSNCDTDKACKRSGEYDSLLQICRPRGLGSRSIVQFTRMIFASRHLSTKPVSMPGCYAKPRCDRCRLDWEVLLFGT